MQSGSFFTVSSVLQMRQEELQRASDTPDAAHRNVAGELAAALFVGDGGGEGQEEALHSLRLAWYRSGRRENGRQFGLTRNYKARVGGIKLRISFVKVKAHPLLITTKPMRWQRRAESKSEGEAHEFFVGFVFLSSV